MSQLGQFMTRDELPPSRNQRSRVRLVVGALVAVTVIVVAWSAWGFVRDLTAVADYPGPGTGEVEITVARGDSLTTIARALADADVVKSTDAFLHAADANADSATIGPGLYVMRLQMSGEQALQRMLDPASRSASRLVLPEGLTLNETVATTSKATGIAKKDLRGVLDDPTDLGLPTWAKDRPEGFMFPATYDIAGDEDATKILQGLVKRFNQASADIKLESRAAKIGRTPYEVLIVASLLQAEGIPNDFGKVARVIYNRLEADMPLQLDSTVAYGLDEQRIDLTDAQLKKDTPYNTYTRTGLPPTPINSPGDAAIEAALSPAKGKWLYFVTVNPETGETKFTKNYDTFLKYKDEFKQYLQENPTP